jgi:TolB-like protein/DNA-binding winged helix-turn-helix (wHTH) protein/Tfp pilus assembly protein PilF
MKTDSFALRIGAWRVDPALDEISKDGSTVKLERRAMQLLVCLAEHAGQVVSVEQLLDKVWTGVVVTPDSVYHAVAALRRVLGDNSKEPTYIANVPRRGYRLVAPVKAWPDPPRTPIENARRPSIGRVNAIIALLGLGSYWRRFAIALSIVLVGALGYVVDRVWLFRHVANEPPVATLIPAAALHQPAISEKSIAVLPFVDMSEKKDQEYLADGMAEEIIAMLVKVPNLHVPARTSSFYFKGKSEDIPNIARKLLVTYILEGSVRKFGDRLRITAQLVRADNGYSLWAETYDRDMHDVFRVQDDIANAVVQALQITLLGGPLTRQQGGTQNLEAYQLYLRSRNGALQNTKPSLDAERKYLEQAVNLDPSFGLAWARMATNSLVETENGMLPAAEGFERAKNLAQRALQLSPDLGEPHACLSYVYRRYDWDWAAAESEVHRALDLDATNPVVLTIAGRFYDTMGHWEDAERHQRSALAHDPLSTYAMYGLGSTLYGAGRYEEAEAMYRRLLEAAPGFSWTRLDLAKTLLMEDKPEAAVAILQQEDEEEYRLSILPIALQAAGRQSKADEALNVLIAKYADSDAYFVAMTYAYRGNRDLALQWLERAYAQKDTSLVEIVGEPLFKNLATDPRFNTFLRKMKLGA